MAAVEPLHIRDYLAFKLIAFTLLENDKVTIVIYKLMGYVCFNYGEVHIYEIT